MSTEDNESILLESFFDPQGEWAVMNDPVMGGESYSSVSIENGIGIIFDGEVVNVPFLDAPGFITMRGDGDYKDVSSCESLVLRARTSEEYNGYRISFGNRHVPGNRYAYGYKANFNLTVGSEMQDMVIPFDLFTVRWSDLNGDPIVSCAENEDFCPDKKTLQNMKTISLWGEGIAGKVHLEIESISATGCSFSSVNDISDSASANSHRGISTTSLFLMITAVATFILAFKVHKKARGTYSFLR